MTEEAFESFAHPGTSPCPKKATISDEILRKGLGHMGECSIPRELWDELVPASLPERLRGVQLPEGKGYPSLETEVMLAVLKGRVSWGAIQDHGSLDIALGNNKRGTIGPSPFPVPHSDPRKHSDPEPPPHFILASWTALGEWL